MRRRAFLLATAGTGLTALGGCLDGETGGDTDDGDDDRSDDSPPFEIRTVDAPGSEAGTVRIPGESRAMLVNLSRTQCPTSEGLLPTVEEARDDLEAADVDATVITVIDALSGPTSTPEELAEWWVEHDGNWTVGLDETGRLDDYYEVDGYPVVVAIDGDGEVHWRGDERASARSMVRGVETALEAQEAESDAQETSSEARD